MNSQNRNNDHDYYHINDTLHTRHDMIPQRKQQVTLGQWIRTEDGTLSCFDLVCNILNSAKEFVERYYSKKH